MSKKCSFPTMSSAGGTTIHYTLTFLQFCPVYCWLNKKRHLGVVSFTKVASRISYTLEAFYKVSQRICDRQMLGMRDCEILLLKMRQLLDEVFCSVNSRTFKKWRKDKALSMVAPSASFRISFFCYHFKFAYHIF